MKRLVKKMYRAEVYPEPYVYGIEATDKVEARKQIKRLYPDGDYRIVITTLRYRIKRHEKDLLNKMKIDEILD